MYKHGQGLAKLEKVLFACVCFRSASWQVWCLDCLPKGRALELLVQCRLCPIAQPRVGSLPWGSVELRWLGNLARSEESLLEQCGVDCRSSRRALYSSPHFTATSAIHFADVVSHALPCSACLGYLSIQAGLTCCRKLPEVGGMAQTFFAVVPSGDLLFEDKAVLKKGLTFHRSELDANFASCLMM